MKKVFAIVLLICVLFCGCTKKYGEEVESAIDALKIEWTALYDEYEAVWDEDVENVLEIKNTKVWIIKNTKIDEFKKIDYLVEFELENNIDYRGYNTVAIYNDGTVVTLGSNPFDLYTMRTGSDDFSSFVEGEEDFKGKYNRTVIVE